MQWLQNGYESKGSFSTSVAAISCKQVYAVVPAFFAFQETEALVGIYLGLLPQHDILGLQAGPRLTNELA